MRTNEASLDTMSASASSSADRFRLRARLVAIWRIRSDELHEAAQLVWHAGLSRVSLEDGSTSHHAALYRPAQLLMGLSLEVLLKGLIVAANPAIVDSDALPESLKTHSLKGLFERANVAQPDTEEGRRLILQLSDAVEWVSKYPVPTKSAHLERTKHGGTEPFGQFHEDFPLYESIRENLLANFPSTGA